MQKQALNDLYGKTTSVALEDDNFLRTKLKNLTDEVNSITHKPAYERALKECPAEVNNDGFRLTFLRSENLDEKVRNSTGFDELTAVVNLLRNLNAGIFPFVI